MPPLALSSPPPPLLDNSPSNLSSPLSDVEDKDTYGDDVDLDMRDHSYMHATPNRNGTADHQDLGADSDSDDSKLSDVDLNDSEAETERLYGTPPKSGTTRDTVNTAGDVGHRQFTDRRDRTFERSPSKLHQQLQADVEAEVATNHRNSASEGEDEDDDISMASSEPDFDAVKERRLRSPTLAKKSQTIPSTDTTISKLVRRASAESRKRKRSPVAGTSESEQPLKKRTGPIDAGDRELSIDDMAMVDDEGIATNPHSGNHTAEEDDNGEPVATTEAKEELPNQVDEDVVVPSRPKKGRRSPTKKKKSKSPEEAGAQNHATDEPPEDADVRSLEVPTPQGEDDHVEGVDEEAEAAHRNEEECTNSILEAEVYGG